MFEDWCKLKNVFPFQGLISEWLCFLQSIRDGREVSPQLTPILPLSLFAILSLEETLAASARW